MVVIQEAMIESKQAMKRLSRLQIRKIELEAPPGMTIKKVTGGYIILPGLQKKPFMIDLKDGEKLHAVQATEDAPAGYIIQPGGGPTLSAKGVSEMINRSIMWIHALTRRGPLDKHSGLQGYINTGSGWYPKFGKGINGAETMYYEQDVKEWAKVYAPPPPVEEDTTELLKLDIPEGVRTLFARFGADEAARTGYVTRTRVIALAKLASRFARFEEFYDPSISPRELAKKLAGTPILGYEELSEKYNLYKPITDRNYIHLQAIALREKWRDNPKKLFNTSSYRRKPRNY